MNTNQTLAAAALIGLLSANAMAISTYAANDVRQAQASDSQQPIEKHACKGMNSCKGQGGGDADHWGKNSCKGKGACATDGSKK